MVFLTGDHGVLEIPAFLSTSGVNAMAVSESDLKVQVLKN